ncbi:MAG: hypothetical protein AVDCRST_MAG83-3663 [uncultured Arthrobacter sp.]|uniref:Uncharacterized protein n=1 Tax=uncultured Arthrobacter sp. TaxID=114050 RepID=A0A6J4JJ01_9MICC|nr:MAG: hypothetical protein AVDCRST_MAG83-3663 [uncultured Arthrobacter sp.]
MRRCPGGKPVPWWWDGAPALRVGGANRVARSVAAGVGAVALPP